MRVIAVPVKSLERAKGRLAPVLSPPERAALTLAMLCDALDACLRQDGWETCVVSPDPGLLEVSARMGASPFHDDSGTLLAALRQVESRVAGPRAELAVLLADVPTVTVASLREALAVDAAVVAAPASSDGGTNLLIRWPPTVIPARFGPNSFGRHRWAARRARVTFEEVRDPALAFDVDRPADLVALLESPPRDAGRRTWEACQEFDLRTRLRDAKRA
jgi:2-phospho-L-lactate/phosphoenolpyruvate guanylyltransferase